jgi:hypothetical protein
MRINATTPDLIDRVFRELASDTQLRHDVLKFTTYIMAKRTPNAMDAADIANAAWHKLHKRVQEDPDSYQIDLGEEHPEVRRKRFAVFLFTFVRDEFSGAMRKAGTRIPGFHQTPENPEDKTRHSERLSLPWLQPDATLSNLALREQVLLWAGLQEDGPAKIVIIMVDALPDQLSRAEICDEYRRRFNVILSPITLDSWLRKLRTPAKLAHFCDFVLSKKK